MENITEESIREQIKTLETERAEFAKNAQSDIDKRQQSVQASQQELQNVVRKYQSDIDKREGAINQLRNLLGETPKPE